MSIWGYLIGIKRPGLRTHNSSTTEVTNKWFFSSNSAYAFRVYTRITLLCNKVAVCCLWVGTQFFFYVSFRLTSRSTPFHGMRQTHLAPNGGSTWVATCLLGGHKLHAFMIFLMFITVFTTAGKETRSIANNPLQPHDSSRFISVAPHRVRKHKSQRIWRLYASPKRPYPSMPHSVVPRRTTSFGAAPPVFFKPRQQDTFHSQAKHGAKHAGNNDTTTSAYFRHRHRPITSLNQHYATCAVRIAPACQNGCSRGRIWPLGMWNFQNKQCQSPEVYISLTGQTVKSVTRLLSEIAWLFSYFHVVVSLPQTIHSLFLPLKWRVPKNVLVRDVTDGNNMACFLELINCNVDNRLTMQVFDQNTILMFNEPTTCFGYGFVAIIRPIPQEYKNEIIMLQYWSWVLRLYKYLICSI